MKKFIKAVIVGYVVLWCIQWLKDLFRDEDINNIDDLKRIIKEKLYPRRCNPLSTLFYNLSWGEGLVFCIESFHLGIYACP